MFIPLPGKISESWGSFLRGRSKVILWTILLLWIVVSVLLHLFPVPRNLDYNHWAYGLWVFYVGHVETIQGLAHAVLTGGLCFICMHLLLHRRRLERFVFVMVGALAFSMIMEYVQSLLPFGFGRTCDPADLVSGMSGALVGTLAGLGLPDRQNRQDV